MPETDDEDRNTGAGGTTGSESGRTTGAGGTTGGEDAGGRDEADAGGEARGDDRAAGGTSASDWDPGSVKGGGELY